MKVRFTPAIHRLLSAFCMAIIGWSLGIAQAKEEGPPPSPRLTQVEWLGMGSFLLTSATNIRILIDPFDPEQFSYPPPGNMRADVVFVTHEAPYISDRNVEGAPQIYRSSTAVGVNNGRGILFRGVRSFLDPSRNAMGGRNTIITFKLDGISFVHLGKLGHVLSREEITSVGKCDVLFLPVGIPERMTPKQLLQTATDLGAKAIVPMYYKDKFTPNIYLLPPDDFLKVAPNVKRLEMPGFSLTTSHIPASTETWVMGSPRTVKVVPTTAAPKPQPPEPVTETTVP